MPRLRLLSFLAVLLGVTAAPAAARAQSVGVSTPIRLAGGQQVTPRPDSQNPLGVSYSDCIADLTLQFTVQLAGFNGNASLQVWASLGSDCVSVADRGLDGGTAVCWGVAPTIQDPMVPTTGNAQINVRVQDLVGWQSTSPLPSPALTPPTKGSEACTAQPDYPLVPMYINFLPIDDSGNPVGVAYQYAIQTDLVGPPAPDICESVGDTVYNLSWTPNTDSDTIGYAVYIDPIPGQEGDAGRLGDAGTILVCAEASAATPEAASDAPGDATGDGPADAVADTAAPATGDEEEGGCSTLALGSMPPDSGSCGSSVSEATCNDMNFVGTISPSGDAGTTTAVTTDDAGADGAVEELGPGGISTVSTNYLYNPSNGNPNITIPDRGTGSYSITGLVDYVTYTVVVSAVDGMGNVGPPSTEVCDYPAPVQDFWQVYEADGGGHGGYCALEAVGVGGPSLAGVGIVFVLGAVLRRRRKRR